MATRSIQNYNSSGESIEVKVGGVSSGDTLVTSDIVDARIKVTDDKVVINTSDIDTLETKSVEQDGRLDQMDILNTNQGTAINTNGLNIADLQSPDNIDFNDVTGSEPAWAPGQAYYADGTFNIHGEYDGVTLQLGQEQYIKVVNISGQTIPNGKPVYVTTTYQGLPAIDLAQADTFEKSRVIGLTTMDILNNGTGLVTTIGSISDIDTTALTAGSLLFLSSTQAGEITQSAPDIASSLGIVLVDGVLDGKIFVKVNNHINPPTVLAFMRGGEAGATISTTPTDVINYSAHNNVFMNYDEALGTVTIPSNGVYRVSISITLAYDETGNSEQDMNILVNGSINGTTLVPIKMPRDSTGMSYSTSLSFDATVAEVIKLQLSAPTDDLTGVTYPVVSFEVESSHVRQ